MKTIQRTDPFRAYRRVFATVNYRERDFVEEVYALYGKSARRGAGTNQGVDVVVNYTGGDTCVKSQRCLRVGGRLLLTCRATTGYDPPEDLRFIWTFELKILGSNSWDREDLMRVLDLVRCVESGRGSDSI